MEISELFAGYLLAVDNTKFQSEDLNPDGKKLKSAVLIVQKVINDFDNISSVLPYKQINGVEESLNSIKRIIDSAINKRKFDGKVINILGDYATAYSAAEAIRKTTGMTRGIPKSPYNNGELSDNSSIYLTGNLTNHNLKDLDLSNYFDADSLENLGINTYGMKSFNSSDIIIINKADDGQTNIYGISLKKDKSRHSTAIPAIANISVKSIYDKLLNGTNYFEEKMKSFFIEIFRDNKDNILSCFDKQDKTFNDIRKKLKQASKQVYKNFYKKILSAEGSSFKEKYKNTVQRNLTGDEWKIVLSNNYGIMHSDLQKFTREKINGILRRNKNFLQDISDNLLGTNNSVSKDGVSPFRISDVLLQVAFKIDLAKLISNNFLFSVCTGNAFIDVKNNKIDLKRGTNVTIDNFVSAIDKLIGSDKEKINPRIIPTTDRDAFEPVTSSDIKPSLVNESDISIVDENDNSIEGELEREERDSAGYKLKFDLLIKTTKLSTIELRFKGSYTTLFLLAYPEKSFMKYVQENIQDKMYREQIRRYISDNKKPLTEGGASGHMLHVYEDPDMTFGDLKKIFRDILSEDLICTEKVDGLALSVTYKDGEIYGARNKSTLKNPLTVDEIAEKFVGRGALYDAFYNAMIDLENAFDSLSDEEKQQFFNDGKNFLSMEVVFPATRNVVYYNDRCLLQLHGIDIYDDKLNKVSEDKTSAQKLYQILKSRDALNQKVYSITNETILKIKDSKSAKEIYSEFESAIDKIEHNHSLDDSSTIEEFVALRLRKNVETIIHNLNIDVEDDENVIQKCIDYVSFYPKKSVGKRDLKKELKNIISDDDCKLLANKLDMERKQLNTTAIEPLDIIVSKVGLQILDAFDGYLVQDKSKSASRIQNDLDNMLSIFKNNRTTLTSRQKDTLTKNLLLLKKYGESPSGVEGIVFIYNGKIYKLTGNFKAINQLLGIIKYQQ